jgi:type VI secretion system secreted protein Hcp
MKRSGFKGLIAAGIMATGIASSTTTVLASDMFLKLTGVKGESVDDKHRGEIDVLSWSWGMSTGTGRVKKGTLAPQCIQDLQLTKFTDTATPQLIMQGVMGQTAKEGVLTLRKSGVKDSQEYLVIKMTDVLVTSYQTGGSAGDNNLMMESVVLSFSSIQGEYRPQRHDGSMGDPVVFNISSTCPQ